MTGVFRGDHEQSIGGKGEKNASKNKGEAKAVAEKNGVDGARFRAMPCAM
jgi:hypothetical protein